MTVPWITGAQVKAAPDMSSLSDDDAAIVAQMASDLLSDLSGKQFGVTTTTVRPSGCGHHGDWMLGGETVGWGMALPLASFLGPWPLPGPSGGMPALAQCGGCSRWATGGIQLEGPVVWDSAAARTLTVTTTITSTAISGTFVPSDVGAPISGTGIPVGATIVGQIGTTAEMSAPAIASGTITATIAGAGTHPISILVDGAALDPSRWEIVDKQIVIRTDGGIFPACQNLKIATTEVGTCQVTYSRGTAVPAAGIQAAITLAAEFAKSLGFVTGECRLPERIKTITRQGVSAIAIDPLDIIRLGGTGIVSVDLWLIAVNPKSLRRRASVHTPGLERPLPTVFAGSAGSFG